MASPAWPSFSSVWGLLLMVLAPRLAADNADSIQSDRGDDVVDVHEGRDLTEAPNSGASHLAGDPTIILDSGASHHATSDKSLLSWLILEIYPVRFTRGDFKRLIAGTGSVVSDKIHLADVLYVPDLQPRTVLVSVGKLAASGYLVMFGGGRCIVRSLSGGKVVGEGRLGDDGLYRLDFLKIPLDAAADGADSTV